MADKAPPPHRTQIPNIVDDLGLDPYERALYVHYKRVCGENQGAYCYEAVKTTAHKVKMSTGQVSEARKQLAKRGLILIQDGRPVIVTVANIWDLNTAFYQLEHRPDVDGWTVEQLKLWLADVHTVNVSSHNDSKLSTRSETNLTEDDKDVHPMNVNSPSEHSLTDKDNMSSNVHTVKQRRVSSNPVSSPKKESERESHAHKLKRIGEVDYLNQNETFATKLTEVCGNPHPRYVINGDRKKLAEATAQLLDWKVTIDQLDDFKTYWWGESPPRFEQVTKEWGRYLSSKQQLPRPPNGSLPANKSSPSKSAPIDMDLLRQKQEEALKGQ